MDVAVTLRTHMEFSDLDDINEAQDLIINEMSPEEILEIAARQGNPVNIDVDEC